jgi:hypothetical protein
MFGKKTKKLILGMVMISSVIAGKAYAFSSVANLEYGELNDYGEYMSITGNLKVTGTNTGQNKLSAMAKQNLFAAPDPIYGYMEVTGGTSKTGYTSDVPHSTYYAYVRPTYENGWTSGKSEITNY